MSYSLPSHHIIQQIPTYVGLWSFVELASRLNYVAPRTADLTNRYQNCQTVVLLGLVFLFWGYSINLVYTPNDQSSFFIGRPNQIPVQVVGIWNVWSICALQLSTNSYCHEISIITFVRSIITYLSFGIGPSESHQHAYYWINKHNLEKVYVRTFLLLQPFYPVVISISPLKQKTLVS